MASTKRFGKGNGSCTRTTMRLTIRCTAAEGVSFVPGVKGEQAYSDTLLHVQ